ncbi:MAG: hypothetical protein ACLRPW_05335 [Intestinibacter sp.]
MHNINILLSVNGKNKVYEGIKSCDIYINRCLDEQSLVIDNKTDFMKIINQIQQKLKMIF